MELGAVTVTRPGPAFAPCRGRGDCGSHPNPHISMTLEDRTVLVTGGAGFIGHHLVAALVPDNHVRVLDHSISDTEERLPPSVERIDGDIRDEATLESAMDGVDVVFHQAAMVSVA